jgi:hypothetical protein
MDVEDNPLLAEDARHRQRSRRTASVILATTLLVVGLGLLVSGIIAWFKDGSGKGLPQPPIHVTLQDNPFVCFEVIKDNQHNKKTTGRTNPCQHHVS